MSNKSTHWVTIPEETIHTPASEDTRDSENGMATKNKIFWGTGFVALLIFTATLMAPKQVISILKGDVLEDQGFKSLELIPDFSEQDPLFSGPATESEETAVTEEVPVEEEVVTETAPVNDTVVTAKTDAVTIQIEPVDVQIEPVSEDVDTETQTDETVVTDEQPTEVVVEDVPAEVVEEVVEEVDPIKEELNENRKLLEELSKQLADIKEKDDEKTKIIEDLTEIATGQIEDQELRPSAPASPSVSATASLGNVPAGYRVNTHTVSLTPQQALAQNTATMDAKTNSTIAASQTEAQKLYQAQLSAAQGTPESGPKEAMLLAFILAFVALLSWKIRQLVRD